MKRVPIARSLFLSLFALSACTAADSLSLDQTSQAAGTFPSVTSFSDPGPFATTQEAPAGSNCTIFRPASLGQGGVTNPVILWGNGTFTSPSTYSALLTHLASHGFVVAAANTSNAGDGSQMLACLDFVTKQSTTTGTAFFQRVDLDRVGASGHSQGGAGTIMAGRNPRVKFTAPLAPFINAIPGGGRFDRASIGQQTGPMFLVSAGNDSVAVPSRNQQPVFDAINEPVVWATLAGVGHNSVTGNAGNMRGPVTAWFRANLMDDAAAALLFPPTCQLCTTQNWSVQLND